MQPVLTVSEMRAVDARTSLPIDVLVSRAGHGVAHVALDLLGGAYGRRVVVVAGPGNNGADGRVAAALLRRRGARVIVVDAGAAETLPAADLVIDAAYGTGFRGEYRAPGLSPGTPVLAVDIPSGVDGDTGEARGTPWTAVRTVTFVALKPGLLQGAGAELVGDVSILDIGLPAERSGAHAVDGNAAEVNVVEDGDVAAMLPAGQREDNKWSAAVLVVAGSPGMTGAAELCARAAFRAGAGMVRLGIPGDGLAAPVSEAVGVRLPRSGWADTALAAARRCSAVVVGPGLGRDPDTAEQVRRLVANSTVPVVVDADGLFALGTLDGPVPGDAPTVLTPHDGEYQRLMGSPPGGDRITAARRLALASGAVALVKGPTTAVADPTGRTLLGTTGTPVLATAGTGDVLSGVIGALLARGTRPLEAAGFGAHLHGAAGRRGRTVGLMAGDLPELVSAVLSDLARPGLARPDLLGNGLRGT